MVPLALCVASWHAVGRRRYGSPLVGTFIVAAALIFGLAVCVSKICSRYTNHPLPETPPQTEEPEPDWKEIT